MTKFTISTDNCADYYKSYMDSQNIYSIPLKYIIGGKEYANVFDSHDEFEEFYAQIKKGALPTTSQINPEEFVEHFKKILANEKSGDIIHVSLSSALSGSHNSAVTAAAELNKTLQGRKIYAVDSLHVSAAMMLMIDKLMELRDNTDAEKAVKIVEDIRDHEQVFFIVDDLGHLRRGGRLTTSKMIIGKLLGVKPIMTVNNIGKIAVISKAHGTQKAISYLIEQTQVQAEPAGQDYSKQVLYVLRTSESENFEILKKQMREKYPSAQIKEVQIGPIIGAHLGANAVGVIFKGKPCLDIE